MPTIFIFFGFRFMFYGNDHLPVHVMSYRMAMKRNIMLTIL